MFFDEYLNRRPGNQRASAVFGQAAFFAGNTSSGTPKIGLAFRTGDRDNMQSTAGERELLRRRRRSPLEAWTTRLTLRN
jgi:hypothetical protein